MYDLGRYVTNQHANRKFQTVGNFSNNISSPQKQNKTNYNAQNGG